RRHDRGRRGPRRMGRSAPGARAGAQPALRPSPGSAGAFDTRSPRLRAPGPGGAAMRRLLALALLVTPALGAAHPLGNFTVNRYAAVHVAADATTIRYVVDMAEIPTFQEMRLVDANGDGTLADEEREAYLGRAARTLAESLVLTVDGT